jgi:peptidoglycan-associated lipoprotein
MKMKNFLVVGLLAVGLSLAGCSKKQNVNPDGADMSSGSGDVSDSDISSGASDSDSGNAMGIQTIFFPFDSFEIVGENRETLKNNVKILKDNPTVNVQVEGHCDERGGIQYNLALGEKRANAIKQQLVAGGVAASRVTIISMGKEKPLVAGSGEDVWAKNRRGNFVITAK